MLSLKKHTLSFLSTVIIAFIIQVMFHGKASLEAGSEIPNTLYSCKVINELTVPACLRFKDFYKRNVLRLEKDTDGVSYQYVSEVNMKKTNLKVKKREKFKKEKKTKNPP